MSVPLSNPLLGPPLKDSRILLDHVGLAVVVGILWKGWVRVFWYPNLHDKIARIPGVAYLTS